MTIRSLGGRVGRAVPIAAAWLTLSAALPAAVLGHQLSATYTSRLPLAVYLAGAAMTVALSFVFVLGRDIRAVPPAIMAIAHRPPAAIRAGLRLLGLLAWAWIVAQGILGGSSTGSVAPLFLWVYGWFGMALVSAVMGPAWHFLDPFSGLYDVGAAIIRRLGITPWIPADYPAVLGRWPAVIGFAGFVWLELVLAGGPSTLFVVLVGYTAFTLAMMVQFGRDEWRSNGETFTVWFRLLGRLAAYELVDDDGQVRRRTFASGLLEADWTIAEVALVGLGIGSILFDGLSQTQVFFEIFGAPGLAVMTLLLFGWLGILVAAALGLTRVVGIVATGGGLLPIAVGYLIAHYLTYLLINGQDIVIAISDPFQRGWNLFGTAFYEASGAWIPPGLVWTLQLAAVVGGHMLGAWAGHAMAAAHPPRGAVARTLRQREIPLAIVMVALTTLTLWSLGQALVVQAPAAATDRPTAPTLATIPESATAPTLATIPESATAPTLATTPAPAGLGGHALPH